MSFSFTFYRHIIFRQSCGVCKFCNTKRPSDITIGDFWGWEKTDATINADDKGLSLVLINTEKGRLLFETVKKDMHVISAKLEDCLQTHLRVPLGIHPKRMVFERDYAKYGLERTFKKYALMGWKYKVSQIVTALKRRLKKVVMLILKHI